MEVLPASDPSPDPPLYQRLARLARLPLIKAQDSFLLNDCFMLTAILIVAVTFFLSFFSYADRDQCRHSPLEKVRLLAPICLVGQIRVCVIGSVRPSVRAVRSGPCLS